MQIDIQYNPAHSLATVHLNAGESIRAEASAMVSMTRNIDVQTNAGHGAGGGFFGGLKRAVVGGESFFQNSYTARGHGAHVTLAPRLCGSMVVHEMNPAVDLFIQGSSYVAAPDSVRIDTESRPCASASAIAAATRRSRVSCAGLRAACGSATA